MAAPGAVYIKDYLLIAQYSVVFRLAVLVYSAFILFDHAVWRAPPTPQSGV
jgi:hypothetical protein